MGRDAEGNVQTMAQKKTRRKGRVTTARETSASQGHGEKNKSTTGREQEGHEEMGTSRRAQRHAPQARMKTEQERTRREIGGRTN